MSACLTARFIRPRFTWLCYYNFNIIALAFTLVSVYALGLGLDRLFPYPHTEPAGVGRLELSVAVPAGVPVAGVGGSLAGLASSTGDNSSFSAYEAVALKRLDCGLVNVVA